MIWNLASLPTPVLLALAIGLSVLLSVGGLWLFRRRFPYEVLSEHNEVAGFVYAIIGVIYGVMMAFVAIAQWEEFADTERLVHSEAATALIIFREAGAYSDPARTDLRARLLAYTHSVREQEWPAMALGSASSHTERTLEELWAAVQDLEPRSAVETNWHEKTVSNLESLSLLRRQRLLAMRSEIPGILWSVLLLGGLLTVGYTYLYGVRRLAAQAVITGVLAACIALVFAVSAALDHPFAGPTSVNTESFDDVLEQMEVMQATP